MNAEKPEKPMHVLRDVQPEDNPAVARLIREVMTEFGCVGPGFSICDAEVDCIHEAYSPPGHFFWVIEGPSGIAGCGGIGPLVGGPAEICELKKMYFLPELRGKGWGRKLLETCLQAASQWGYRTCYIETVEHMTNAIRLYKKFGFQQIPGPLGNTGHGGCDLFFSRSLAS